MSPHGHGSDDDEAAVTAISNEEWCSWLHAELRACPAYATHGALLDECCAIAARWRTRFWGRKALWNRMRRGSRLAKELAEAAPVLERARLEAQSVKLEGGARVVVIDLCSGFGYMAMFLSELLPPDKVERIVLVDKAWARHGVERRPHHIDPAHISDPGWPIRLSTSHADLKTPSDRRSLLRAFLSRGCPAMLLGVHLCGTLSLRAVDLFNDSPSFFFLGLKPCCLPPAFFAQRGDVFGSANGHCFAAKAVAVAGKWQRGKWVGGASRQELQRKFAVWVDNLSRCVECDVEGGGGEGGEEAGGAGRGVVAVEQHRVQSLWRLSSCRETSRDLGTHHRRRCERRFLNDFIFCSRPWAALAPRSATSAAHAAGPEASGTLAAVPAPNRSNGAGVHDGTLVELGR
ncbi:hypothetical protein EMIHUDRAFT_203035 [Emiliania huxleyi CCMP1516]|nr:hypothetical protein EMIHUDRAFT_203035 [Emiliania huxleyi CCMP1516]EOD30978.1 hypothetical protein EMIHUDRAFT_203035 [Emiliania huxleyi CCMP1516]|eukprot:XP_005783407.1 hypothetical protein EMIHUDRAFT_203035 [Emiliania huxleyi CCMP1516]